MNRIPQDELLDDSSLSNDQAIQSLRDLRQVNRWFGGISTTSFLLLHAMKSHGMSKATVLEVAAGDGYSVTEAVKRLRRENLNVEATCLDKRNIPPESRCCERSVVGDALSLDLPPNSVDFVSCGLFLHHLSPEQVVHFVNDALKIARLAVLINDLRRSRIHLGLVRAWAPMFKSHISRFDGPASIQQAYTPTELHDILKQTPTSAIEIHRKFLFRIAAIAWK